MFVWPWSKYYLVKCPDGTKRMVYKNVDDAFPISIADERRRLSADLDAAKQVKGKVSSEYASKIQGLLIRIDELNQDMYIKFRAMYISYGTHPCLHHEKFADQIAYASQEQSNLRSAIAQIRLLITVASESKTEFHELFRDLVNKLGGINQVPLARFEIKSNRQDMNDMLKEGNNGE